MRIFPFFLLVSLLVVVRPAAADEGFVQSFGKGINMSNMLEAPKEGDWGFRVKEEYFTAIKDAGFQHVRIPVSWSTHTHADAPFTIDPEFLQRVDTVVDQAMNHGLAVVLDVHHYNELTTDPDGQRDRFLAIWGQLAPHYKDKPTTFAMELLNEPKDLMTVDKWNVLAAEAIDVIRETNPDRYVIVGPVLYNTYRMINTLQLPEDDAHLVATFHFYDPMQLTHQGAGWVGVPTDGWIGTKWTGTEKERAAVTYAFELMTAWSEKHNIPVYLGEYGTIHKADMDSRVRWTRAVSEEAERRGFASAYWGFCAGFGAFDPRANAWREGLKEAIVGEGDPGPGDEAR